jgi:hypothetical protein
MKHFFTQWYLFPDLLFLLDPICSTDLDLCVCVTVCALRRHEDLRPKNCLLTPGFLARLNRTCVWINGFARSGVIKGRGVYTRIL